ncbi:hypothetical protein HK105_203292 [Polyrhizophydium stewartii]|uniref:G-protein coupled receptors family 1 profile domain-containing protein n=1 Tax=Polyrhizophydium stewartii TaxID=2732419 RepID=A0ABR4NCG6_9FUNG
MLVTTPKMFASPTGRLVVALALADFVGAVAVLLNSVPADDTHALCQAQSALLEDSGLVSLFISVAMTFNALYVIYFRGSVSVMHKWSWIAIGVCLGLPIAFSVPPIFMLATPDGSFSMVPARQLSAGGPCPRPTDSAMGPSMANASLITRSLSGQDGPPIPATRAMGQLGSQRATEEAVYGATELWCWIPNNLPFCQLIFFYVEFAIVFVIHVVAFVATFVRQRIISRQPTPTKARHAAAQMAAQIMTYRISIYLVALTIIWGPGAINRLVAFLTGRAIFELSLLHALTMPMRGFINYIAFLMARKRTVKMVMRVKQIKAQTAQAPSWVPAQSATLAPVGMGLDANDSDQPLGMRPQTSTGDVQSHNKSAGVDFDVAASLEMPLYAPPSAHVMARRSIEFNRRAGDPLEQPRLRRGSDADSTRTAGDSECSMPFADALTADGRHSAREAGGGGGGRVVSGFRMAFAPAMMLDPRARSQRTLVASNTTLSSAIGFADVAPPLPSGGGRTLLAQQAAGSPQRRPPSIDARLRYLDDGIGGIGGIGGIEDSGLGAPRKPLRRMSSSGESGLGGGDGSSFGTDSVDGSGPRMTMFGM